MLQLMKLDDKAFYWGKRIDPFAQSPVVKRIKAQVGNQLFSGPY